MGGPMVGMFVSGGNNGGWPEYVRADIVQALTAERDALIAQRDAVPFDTDALGMGLEMAAQSTIRIVTKERDEALADNAWLRKSCECAMSEIRDYMQEVGVTLPLELAMGWLSAALNTGKEPGHD
jgi:hypothetical protein